MKQGKHILVGFLLIALVISGLSRLRIQSVDSYRQEQKQEAALLEEGQMADDIQAESAKESLMPEETTSEEDLDRENLEGEKKAKAKTADSKKDVGKKENHENSEDSSGGLKKSQSGKEKDTGSKASEKGSGGSGKNSKNNNSKKDSSKNKDNKQTANPAQTEGSANAGQATPGSEAGPNNSVMEDPVYSTTQTPSSNDIEKVYCTIEIRCDSLTKRTDLQDNVKKYVPNNGVIMAETKVAFSKGESVYQILNKVCKAKEIQIDAIYSVSTGTNYIRGIGYLYEKAAGDMSGWIYKVNDISPNKGAAQYKISEGDKIVWSYTCDGVKD